MTAPAAAPSTVTMYAPDGAAVEVPAAQVADTFRAGKLGFRADQQIPVALGRNKSEVITGADADKFFNSALGYARPVVGDQQYAEQEEAKQYDTVGHGAAAFGLGVARGATLGVSDQIGASLGGRDLLAKEQKHHPYLSTAGEAIPLLAAAIPTEGASLGALGARGLTAAPRALGAVGEGAAALARAGAEGLGLAREGIAAKTIAGAAQGATEGALYGVGNAVSDAAIKDEPLTAEKILAAGGMSAFLGGAGGGALGLLGGTITKAGGMILGRTEQRLAGREAALVGDLEAGTLKQSTRDAVAVEHAAQGQEQSAAKQWLSTLSDEQALKATGGTQKMMGDLEKRGSHIKEHVLQQYFEELPKALGKEEGAVLSHAEQAAGAETNFARKQKKVTGLVRDLDAMPGEARPSILRIADEAEKRILTDLRGLPGESSKVAWVEGYLHDLQKMAPDPDFKRLYDLRVKLDAKTAFDKLDPLSSAKKELRGIIDGEIKRAGDARAAEAGQEFAGRYQRAKDELNAAGWLLKSTKKGEERIAANRSLGLSEQFGALRGLLTGAAVGGPAGAALGVMGSVAGAALQHGQRLYGSQAVASLARAAVRGDFVQGVSRAIDSRIGEGVTKFLGSTARTARRLPSIGATLAETDRAERRQTMVAEYDAKRARVAQLLTAPNQHATMALAGVQHVPGVAAAAQQQAVAAATYLQSKAPVRQPDSLLQPHLKPPVPSRDEMSKWLRTVHAVEDPMSVIEDLEDGRLSREGVDAMKTVYPLLYKQMQSDVLQKVAEHGKELTYKQRLLLGTLLQIPTDASIRPDAIAVQQQGYAASDAQQAQQKQSGSGAPKRPIDPATSIATTTEDLDIRGKD